MRLQTSAGFVSLRAWAEAKGVRLTWEKDDKSWGSAHDEGFWTVVRRVDTTLEREARDASAAVRTCERGLQLNLDVTSSAFMQQGNVVDFCLGYLTDTGTRHPDV
ncbi:hypothetical protein JCM1840_002148 [Sporobolomyces johnsonii]